MHKLIINFPLILLIALNKNVYAKNINSIGKKWKALKLMLKTINIIN